MESRYVVTLIFFIFISDIIGINSSYAIMSFLNPIVDNSNNIFLFLNLAWFFSIIIVGLYSFRTVQTLQSIIIKSVYAVSIQAIIFLTIVMLVHGLNFRWYYGISFFAGGLLALTLVRLSVFVAEKYILDHDLYKRKIAILGSNEVTYKLGQYFLKNKLTFNFAGYYNYNQPIAKATNNTLEELKNSIQFSIENNLDEVYSTLFPEDCKELAALIELADQHCVRIMFVTTASHYNSDKRILEMLNYKLHSFYNGIPVLVKRREPVNALNNRILKRAFDIIFSLAVIVFVLSWLYPILAILIKLESNGPVIFMQQRSGKNNKPFWCFKFRSMAINAESNSAQAVKNDTRITRIGAILRKTSLDELPQFFNVLLGDMSVVGPRPHMINHTEKYRLLIDNYMVRHFSKPGITGWAQVKGFRGETKDRQQMVDRVEHDIWYIENWSFFKDAAIILKTVSNSISGEENAY